MTDRLVHLNNEYRAPLAADDPTGEYKIYPRGWRGRVPADLAKDMIESGAGRDITTAAADEGDAEDRAAAKKAVTDAKRALTKANKAVTAKRADVGEDGPTLEQSAAIGAAEQAASEAQAELDAAEQALDDLDD